MDANQQHASNLAAMIAKARRNNPPPKQAGLRGGYEPGAFGDMRRAVYNDPSLYAAAPAIGAGLGGLYGAFTAPPGRGLLSTLRGAAVGGLGGAGFSAALHPEAKLETNTHSVTLNPFAAGSIGLGLAHKIIPKVPEQESKYPDNSDYGDESAPEDTRTYSKQPKDKKKKDTPMKAKDKNKAKSEKKADLFGAASLGSNLGLLGGAVGAGAGGLYGGVTGAYGAPTGQKLRGALRAAGRGAAAGGLLGGGTGLGMGAAMGGQLPISKMLENAKMPLGEDKTQAQQALIEQIKNNLSPEMFAGLTTAGTMGGAALGGYAGNKLLRHMDKPQEDDDSDNKEAKLKLSPHTGIKTPDKNRSARDLNKMLENARKQREDKEQRMRAVNSSKSQIFVDSSKAASAWSRIKQALEKTAAGPAWRVVNGVPHGNVPADKMEEYKRTRPAVHHSKRPSFEFKGEKKKKADDKKKEASALAFGQLVKQSLNLSELGERAKGIFNDPTAQAGLMYGGVGAGLGGLYGAINPGEYEDEYGQVKRRGRFMGALRGAAGGGLLGGAVGAGAQEGRHQYLKRMMGQGAYGSENANALQNADRATALRMTDQYAQDNAGQVGNLATSPADGLRNAYSQYVAPQMAKFKPKRPMGDAPATGVDAQTATPGLSLVDPNTGSPVGGN